MPIKKKVPVKKAAVKKVVIGPKAKLMKLAVTTLRTKAKKLGVSDVTKRTKENLAQSIILGEARKKRGTAAGKKATAKRAVSPTRQTGTSNLVRDLMKRLCRQAVGFLPLGAPTPKGAKTAATCQGGLLGAL